MPGNCRWLRVVAVLVSSLIIPSALCAQDVVVTSAEGQARGRADRFIPALTPVTLRFEEEMSSQTSKTGARFAISLAEPITIDGAVVIPAGTTGEGEVIHAKKSGGGGSAGELVLAARWLDVKGRHLRLRSMRPGAGGRDAVGAVDAFNAAAVVAPVPIGLLGFAMTGKGTVYAKGSPAAARTAEAFVLEGSADNSNGLPMQGRPATEGDENVQ